MHWNRFAKVIEIQALSYQIVGSVDKGVIAKARLHRLVDIAALSYVN